MSVESIATALIAAAILTSMPLMLAAVGEAIAERAGLLNLGIEGSMLCAGFASFWLTLKTDSVTLGLLIGAAVGLAIGLVFGTLATVFNANQIVLGLGITLAGTGGTAFLFREVYGSDQPLLSGGPGRPFDTLFDWLPVIGPAIGDQRWFVFVAWFMVLAGHLFLVRTRTGLQLRAAGESPFGLEAVGGNVTMVRIGAAAIGGAYYGFGGAALAVVELGFFSPGITAGAGFLAVAMAMLGRLSPLRVGLFTLAFGLLTGLDTGLQIAGVDARPEFLRMLPYAGIVIGLVVLGRGVRMPRALGQAYGGISSRR